MALTDAERQLLEELEKTLTVEDPKLVSKFAKPVRPVHSAEAHPGLAVVGVLGFVVGLIGLIVGMSLYWWISVIGFVIMLASVVAVISVWTRKPGSSGRSSAASSQPSARPSGEDFLSRMEQRWRDRQEQ
ncbi:MAG: DUF3040 domain-containing protein [Propionibacteriaceae bacterium]|jgi:ABC-type multidrug transport system fused ATPase/permease subunit|nr:DUF3040 domain-containing protein [Propionibacteriaceae bacterium]